MSCPLGPANALTGLGCSPAELTWKAGVDLMSFGATKNGAMMLEAVIFFDSKLADDFAYRRMRGGQLVSKARYPWVHRWWRICRDDLWLDNARRANALATQLADGLRHSKISVLPIQWKPIWFLPSCRGR